MSINLEALVNVSGPTSVPLTEVEVTLNPELMVDGYAKALVREAQRKSPLRFKDEPLSEEDIIYLCRSILKMRVDYANNENVPWRQMKLISIPDFIQMSISMIGTVTIKESGIKLIPIMNYDFDISKVLEISERLDGYDDVIHMSKDAFPREHEGNVDVMSTALINDYVQSLGRVTHPADTYVAAFLGFKLKEETVFQILYRVKYDDINYVQESIKSIWPRII